MRTVNSSSRTLRKATEKTTHNGLFQPLNFQGFLLALFTDKVGSNQNVYHVCSIDFCLLWVFPKNNGPPNHPFVHRVFHYFHHPFWGFYPYFSVQHPYLLGDPNFKQKPRTFCRNQATFKTSTGFFRGMRDEVAEMALPKNMGM